MIEIREGALLHQIYVNCCTIDDYDYGQVEQLYAQMMGWC